MARSTSLPESSVVSSAFLFPLVIFLTSSTIAFFRFSGVSHALVHARRVWIAFTLLAELLLLAVGPDVEHAPSGASCRR